MLPYIASDDIDRGTITDEHVVFRREWDVERITRFVEGLWLFRLGFSWGGTHSLVMAYPPLPRMRRGYEGRVVRFNVGLEEPADLIADLRHSLSQIL